MKYGPFKVFSNITQYMQKIYCNLEKREEMVEAKGTEFFPIQTHLSDSLKYVSHSLHFSVFCYWLTKSTSFLYFLELH